MMRHKEIDEWTQYAKDLAKAERELKIEHWVCISFEIQTGTGIANIQLHHLDLPRHMLDRWLWVINWRRAKFICQYPKENVLTYFSYYDKKTGLDTGFNSLLYCLSATKAQVTKVERRMAEYIEYNRQNNIFFDEETDEQLLKVSDKLNQKKLNVEKMLLQLKEEVEQHRKKYENQRTKAHINKRLSCEAGV